ncbi:Tautomerase/MIF superfamily [Irpex rosettiformis]|uniref:Tautomerase/MIF superfamily n=1 Tax=Irpex rosettiformis TaxID=378272 RepID=A0ACB8U124_9APHY|nr:Tautomerase/MIF superfamily [Irpex rosettiformis]
MPSLELKTNVKLDDPKAFLVEFSKFAAETLGKPESYIVVSYTHQEFMAWHGTFDPAYLLSVVSLGNINPEANITYSKKFSDFFQTKLGAPSTRGYISLIDPGIENLGYSGTTFGTIFGKK